MLSSARKPATYGLPALRSSDSHDLVQIGSAWTALEMREPVFEELVLAIKRTNDEKHRRGAEDAENGFQG
jgi:PHP family Zn ribbon phosphoesterase